MLIILSILSKKVVSDFMWERSVLFVKLRRNKIKKIIQVELKHSCNPKKMFYKIFFALSLIALSFYTIEWADGFLKTRKLYTEKPINTCRVAKSIWLFLMTQKRLTCDAIILLNFVSVYLPSLIFDWFSSKKTIFARKKSAWSIKKKYKKSI